MEYNRRQMLKGASVVEPTAVTMKSIKAILEEEGHGDLLDKTAPAKTSAAAAPGEPALKRPPTAEVMARAQVASPAAAPAKRGSLLSRIFDRG